MNELIQQITSRTPLNAQQAQEVIQVVADFLKARVPAPLAGTIDALLAGGGIGGALGGGADGAGAGLLGAIEGEIGSLFGPKH